MLKYCFLAILFLGSAFCQIQTTQTSNRQVENKANLSLSSAPDFNASNEGKNGNEFVESFTNTTSIGVPHKNKIEIFETQNAAGKIVEIMFYFLSEDKEWKLTQTFEFEDHIFNPQPEFEDFNNDGRNDFTYQHALAGRGANELRRLFIYDKKKNQLIFIKNSGEYPNLKFNKRLNSLTAQRFYGDTTVTEFLEIEGDSLKEFAYVESSGNQRSIVLIDKNGNERLLKKYKIDDLEYLDRFKNYDPLEIENEY